MWRLEKYWLGLAIILAGVILLAGNFGWMPAKFTDFWPVLVIVWGVSNLIRLFGQHFGWFRLVFYGLVTTFGVLQLLENLKLSDIRAIQVFSQWWPLFILAIGLEMLFGSRGPRRRNGWKHPGRVYRERGAWNVRWEDVSDPSPRPVATVVINGDCIDKDEAGPATAETTGAEADASESEPQERKRKYRSGYTDQTRIAGELRFGSRPWDLDPDTVMNLGAGEVELDLSTARIGPGDNNLTIRLWAGTVTIYVPSGLAIALDSRLTAGQIEIFGDDHSGLGPSVNYRTDDYDGADRRVNIRTDMMFGQVVIKEAR